MTTLHAVTCNNAPDPPSHPADPEQTVTCNKPRRKPRRASQPPRWLQLDVHALPHLAQLVRSHPAAAQCFLYLLTVASKRNRVAITARQLAALTGLAQKTVEHALSALLRLGYVARLPELGPSALALNAAIVWLDSRQDIPLAPFLDPRPFPPPAKTTKTVNVPIVALQVDKR